MNRDGCGGSRHGDESAYVNSGCTCDDARTARNHRQKERRVGQRPALVDATPVARKLQALAAIGWSSEDLAAQLGVTFRAVQLWRGGHYPTVQTRTAAAVDRMYADLQGTPGPSPRSRAHAEVAGWAPPLAWDDIDDVNDRPLPAPGPSSNRPRVDPAEVAFMESFGFSRDHIAARLGVTSGALERANQRAAYAASPPEWVPAAHDHVKEAAR